VDGKEEEEKDGAIDAEEAKAGASVGEDEKERADGSPFIVALHQ
jgi:hypothetical protein